jgi:hypothetical protein
LFWDFDDFSMGSIVGDDAASGAEVGSDWPRYGEAGEMQARPAWRWGIEDEGLKRGKPVWGGVRCSRGGLQKGELSLLFRLDWTFKAAG